ncbi:MAG: DUF1573 domain-containing protein [Planctomycetota bacterium]
MNNNTRWLGVAFGLGLCAAYVLWGSPPSVSPSPIPADYSLPALTSVAQNTAPGVAPIIDAPSALKFNPPGLDFGEVLTNEKKVLLAMIQNTGKFDVTIEKLEASCGCLVGEMKDRTIGPGQIRPVEVKFFASPKQWTGTLSLYAVTNEEGHPRVLLAVKGQIKQEFYIEPMILNFEYMRKGETKTLEAVIRRANGKPFVLKDIRVSNREFVFKWMVIEGSQGSAYKISATATGVKAGQFSEGAAVMIADEKTPAIPLPLRMQVMCDVTCSPGTVWSQQASDGTTGVFETVVTRNTPGKLTILQVKEKDDATLPLEFSTEPITDAVCRLKIRLLGEFKKRAPFGHFLIQTDVEDQPLTLPYLVRLHKPPETGKG